MERDRRRALGQNFLRPDVAERLVDGFGIASGELVLEIGAGAGALTKPLIRRGARVVAIERDPVWADRLRVTCRGLGPGSVRVVSADARSIDLPRRPFRVVASLPFGATTDILAQLFDDPSILLERADLIVQWEVARKRASAPPATLRSTQWAPWWEFALGSRIDRNAFRPVPRVDAGVLTIVRRTPALLPIAMAPAYARFVRNHWPFEPLDLHRRR